MIQDLDLVGQLASGAATQTDAQKERKKLQNRRNQQARRDRLRQSKADEDTSKSSFSVQRWRLKKEKEPGIAHPEGQLIKARSAVASASPARPDPQADLLLTLISENIFRALGSNKSALRGFVSNLCRDFPSSEQHMSIPQPCEGLIITIPQSHGIPVSLLPTPMQMAVPHTGWIDTMPFPRMRDNLIRRHDQFDHWRFLGDLGGYLVDRGLITGPHTPTLTSQIRSASGEYKIDGPKEDDGDDPLSEWNGAIVWGQPYEKENWEFTVHFLEKWAWVFEGCEEIVSVTNTWRQGRGAPLLQPRIQGTTSSYAEPLPRAVQKMGA